MPPHRRHFRPPAFSSDRPGLVRPVRVDPAGETGPTRAQSRGAGWTKAGKGLFVPSSVDRDHVWQRILEASQLLPPYAAVTGWAGLAWANPKWLAGRTAAGDHLPIPVVAPEHQIRPQPGIQLSEERLKPADLIDVAGVRITTHVRSACFEARRSPNPRTAAAWFDRAAGADLASLDELAAYVRELNGWTGVETCRRALPLASENAWSPAEHLMRMLWVVDLGLPKPLCNPPVFDLSGRHIGTPDLLDLESGTAGEYDSELHWKQRGKDLRKESALRRAGLEVVTMVGGDLADPSDFLQRTLDARSRGLARRGERRWTVVPPPWWTPTVTVTQRRSLSAWQRERWLRWQAA